MDTKAIETWVVEAFKVCKIFFPPKHLVEHYVQMLATQQLSYQIVQEELLMLTGHSQQQPQQPNLQQTTATQAQMPAASAPPPTAHGPSKVGVFAKDMNKDQAKAYVDDLYIKYTGKIGDPATTNFLVSSMLSNSYTLQQTEYSVAFSKEAKEYAKTKKEAEKHQRNKMVIDFIKELYRVYLKNANPSDAEIEKFAIPIIESKMTLEDAENEFKMLSFDQLDKLKRF